MSGLAYAPSSFAHLNELISLAQVVKKYDRILVAHIRDYSGHFIKSIEEFIELLRKSGAKGLHKLKS
jgi:N-acyl-D-amino-acid deacylase